MKKFAQAFLIGFILTSIFTWPLIARLPNPISKHPDYNFGGFTYWYNQNALITGKIFHPSDYFNGFNEFYPQPYVLGYSDITPIPSLIYAPIFWLTHQYFFSLNFYIFLCFIFSFISAYYCIDYFVKNSLASIVGASVYTFNPLTFGHFPEHVDLLNKFFLPPLFLSAFLFFQNPKLKSALIFLLFFLLNSLSALYFQLYSIFFLPLVFIPFLFWNAKKDYFIRIIKYGVLFIALVPPLLFFNYPYIQTSTKEDVQRSLDETLHFSSRLVDYFTPTVESFLYGSLSKELDPELNNTDPAGVTTVEEEHTMALNFLPAILFLLSFIYLMKKEGLWEKLINNFSYSNLIKDLWKIITIKPYLYFYILLFSSFILTFGPYFLGWIGYSGDLKLPYYYLYQFIPFIKGMRVPTRFEFIFYIPFSLMVSFGALYLIEDKPKKSGFVILMILLTVLFFENYNIKPLNDDTGNSQKIIEQSANPALSFLKGQNTLHIPIFSPYIGGNAIYLLSATNLDDKFANGYSGYFPPDQLNFLDSWRKNLDQNSFKELLSLNIRYVIIHKDLLDKDYPDLSKNSKLFQQGSVYNDSHLQVIDLTKYNLNPRICNFDKDITKSLTQDPNDNSFTLTVKNPTDCYLPSIYDNRYKNIDIFSGLIKHTATFKMPILLDPGQQVTFSEDSSNLKIN